jgi:hypothetical protein
MTDSNVIFLDILESDHSVWMGSQRVCSPSIDPMRSIGRSLLGLRMPLSTSITIRKFGKIIRMTTLSSLLGPSSQAVTP